MSATPQVRCHPESGVGTTGTPGASQAPGAVTPSKIRVNGSATEQIESRWRRPLNKTGTGATHVRTFSAKLTPVGLEYLDKLINEWLDTHPDAEVKFATLVVGELAGNMGKEPALLVQVWL